MSRTIIIFVIILLASMGTIIVSNVFAEPGVVSTQGKGPYVDPIVAYYDNLEYRTYPLEPVYYTGFYIQPIREALCDQLTPVYGIVPKDGILTFTVVSGDVILFSNVSHSYQYYLINYFYLPCEGIESTATLGVYFIYNDPHDQEFYPNTKVRDMGFTSGAMFVQQTFNVHD